MGRVTLRDLSGELGITVAAVSMALRNHPRISEATRLRARAAAQRLGYTPNPALSRQAGLRGPTVRPPMPMAFVAQRHPRNHPAASPPVPMLDEIRGHAARLGYNLQVFVQDEPHAPAALDDVLYNRGIEAVVVGPVYDPSLIAGIDWTRYSVVGCQTGYVRPPFHYVHWDMEHAMDRSIRACLARGYCRIGVVQYRETRETEDHTDRYGALCLHEKLLRGGRNAIDALDVWSDDATAFARWFKRFRPDAIVAQTPTPLWWLREQGVEAGRDCGLVALSIEETPLEHGVTGFVTATCRPAVLALRLLDAEVRAFERGLPEFPSRQLVEAPWFEGRTLPSKG